MGTPLHIAVQQGKPDIVAFLIARGADPALLDSAGRSSFELAGSNGSPEILDLLIGVRHVNERTLNTVQRTLNTAQRT